MNESFRHFVSTKRQKRHELFQDIEEENIRNVPSGTDNLATLAVV